jgi:hypothetical protein
MTTATIDTLQFARKLRDRGLDERTADTIAEEVGHFVADNLAAPAEVAQIKGENTDIKSRLSGVENRLSKIETDLAEFKGETRSNFRWMKWGMGFIIAAIIGIVWQLIAVNQQLAAIAAMVERIAQ